MSGDISWVSAVIAVFSGLAGVVITNITSSNIANRNRKVQSELTLKEMAQKEKIEYHKIAVEHLMNKARYLNEWNIKFQKIFVIEELFNCINNGNDQHETLVKIKQTMVSFSESIAQLSVYLPEQKVDELIEINSKCQEEMKSFDGSDEDSFKSRNTIFIKYLKDCRNLIRVEIASLVKQIDELIKKYLV